MEADHRGICKFLTANSQNYLLVLESLQELVDAGSTEAPGGMS